MIEQSSGAMFHPGVGQNGETSVYRLRDASGALLYVGMGPNPMARWAAHAAKHSWWPRVAGYEVAWFPTREEAAAEERRSLKEEDPECNIHGSARWGQYLAEHQAALLRRARSQA